MAVAPHGGPGGSPAALCHFLSAEKVKPGLPVRPEYYSNEAPRSGFFGHFLLIKKVASADRRGWLNKNRMKRNGIKKVGALSGPQE